MEVKGIRGQESKRVGFCKVVVWGFQALGYTVEGQMLSKTMILSMKARAAQAHTQDGQNVNFIYRRQHAERKGDRSIGHCMNQVHT